MCLHPGNTNEQQTAIPLEKEVTKMLSQAKFIYCADAGLGSYNIRKFNSMGGRAFIVTQSIKKLSDTLKTAVFNDYDYKLLSSDTPVTIKTMKSFDRHAEKNLPLYNDFAYKVIEADKALDLGLYENVTLKNGKTVKRKATGILKQRIIITFSRKMMEYQRTVRNRQIECAKKILDSKDPEEIKKLEYTSFSSIKAVCCTNRTRKGMNCQFVRQKTETQNYLIFDTITRYINLVLFQKIHYNTYNKAF